ncbi:MAG: redox-regulated ATPase YchF [Acidobacteria bacterium]|nr:redox-regulated ATPase YchF [Acidobacteriota bacterium]MCB9397442.1 redox-regulated ATPase YchF [Acidobacteriota bacterium]
MALAAGIVGLPNVGKSTIFNAISSGKAESNNYPFCTIEPNVGRVGVPDERLGRIQKLIPTQRVIPASIEIVDIAGLVKGASQGAGLGNKFLGHIREVDAVLHVVRCFEDGDITHVSGKVDPVSDIETVELELIFADMDSVEKRLQRMGKMTDADSKKEIAALKKAQTLLADGHWLERCEWSEDERLALKPLCLLSMKPVLYVANVHENDLEGKSPHVATVRDHAQKVGEGIVVISGKIEAELAALDPEEAEAFLADLGLKESGLAALARETYRLLGLQSYFTAGVKEIRAWTIEAGTKAPGAAGVIHSDFEKGFIRAEVFTLADLEQCGSETEIRNQGKLRLEGKEYVVQDGDIMHFRFNV